MVSPSLKLYCSYALLTWGDRLWSFALGLILIKIGSDLRLPAISGLVNGVGVLVFGASVGRWIDRSPRLFAAKALLTVNNMAIVASVCALLVVLTDGAGLVDTRSQAWLEWTLVGASILLCAVSILAGTGSKIVFTKDWIVVMCAGEKDKLADTNAMLLRIDLTAMIISPLIAGQLMTSVNVAAGAIFIALWNVCSFGFEYYFLSAVYRAVPALAHKQGVGVSDEAVSTARPSSDEEDATPKSEQPRRRSGGGGVVHAIRSAIGGWGVYFGQSVLPAAIGLAMLYMTVLGLGSITTGFAYSQGLQENVLAVARGVGALVGILGSFVFPRLRASVGLARTGLVALVLQLLFSALAVLSVWLPGSPFDPLAYFAGAPPNATVNGSSIASAESPPLLRNPSIWSFLCGITLARFGLWMADLSITQIMQEGVAEEERGVVNGVQSSLNRLLDLLKDVLVIALPDPRTFGLLIVVSWLSVFAGFCSYCLYSYRTRGHLLPFHRAFSSWRRRSANRANNAAVLEPADMTRF